MWWLRVVVPAALRESVGKRELKRTLETKDPRVAKERAPKLVAEFNAILRAARDPVGQTASLRQIDAAIGAWYAAQTARYADDPGDAEMWDEVMSYYSDLLPRTDTRNGDVVWFQSNPTHTAETEALLRSHAIDPDRATVSRAAPRFAAAQFRLAKTMLARADIEGDWSPDANLGRFPAPLPSPTTTRAPALASSAEAALDAVVEGWWKEGVSRNLAASTRESYAATFKRLGAFLGHQDARSVTPGDIVRFKDHRLATINPRTGKPLSHRTVKDSDLAALKAVFGWAVVNLRVASNPAKDVTMGARKPTQTRDKGFTDTEANALLAAATEHERGRAGAKTFAARRWAPWLCAYTGARVGEIAQLRQEDVLQDGGVWVVRLTPEAGTMKDKEARDVALHPHLVEMGFPDFAKGAPAGYLFLTPTKAGIVGPWKAVKNRLQEFARETVRDRRVQPNHGWRHRFVTVARKVDMRADAVKVITGHAPASVGDTYGDLGADVQFRELSKMPRYPERAEKSESL